MFHLPWPRVTGLIGPGLVNSTEEDRGPDVRSSSTPECRMPAIGTASVEGQEWSLEETGRPRFSTA
jgi:hypothetical protein